MVQNNTIEERLSLLEIQVAGLREDVTEVDEDVTRLDEDVSFLFDEQVIQDERLLELEQRSVEVVVELAKINANILGNLNCVRNCSIPITIFDCYIRYYLFNLNLDMRVVDLEENGGSGGNSCVAELEVRVETLEGTAADHETRLTTTETDIEGLQFV